MEQHEAQIIWTFEVKVGPGSQLAEVRGGNVIAISDISAILTNRDVALQSVRMLGQQFIEAYLEAMGAGDMRIKIEIVNEG